MGSQPQVGLPRNRDRRDPHSSDSIQQGETEVSYRYKCSLKNPKHKIYFAVIHAGSCGRKPKTRVMQGETGVCAPRERGEGTTISIHCPESFNCTIDAIIFGWNTLLLGHQHGGIQYPHPLIPCRHTLQSFSPAEESTAWVGEQRCGQTQGVSVTQLYGFGTEAIFPTSHESDWHLQYMWDLQAPFYQLPVIAPSWLSVGPLCQRLGRNQDRLNSVALGQGPWPSLHRASFSLLGLINSANLTMMTPWNPAPWQLDLVHHGTFADWRQTWTGIKFEPI